MALVKRFRLDVAHWDEGDGANVFFFGGENRAQFEGSEDDLNRAIVYTVAALQQSRAKGER